MGQTKKAISVLRELARIYAGQGNEIAQNDAYRRLLELDPADGEARQALGSGTTEPKDEDPVSQPAKATGPISMPPGEQYLSPAEQIQLYLSDVDLLLKYSLQEHAQARLAKVFELEPNHPDGLAKKKDLAEL